MCKERIIIMKRLLTSCFSLLVTASIAVSSVFGPLSTPVFAQAAATEASQAQSASTETGKAQSASTEAGQTQTASTVQDQAPASSEEADATEAVKDTSKATADNPIGEHCAHYNVDGFEDAPTIAADSAFLMDARTGAILYSYEGYPRRYPASITKVMTALLAIEYLKMDDNIVFTKEAVEGIEAGSSSAGINAGAVLSVEDTLYALMLASANEAAAAIAQNIAGSDKAFGKLMTRRAKELGCTNTRFRNPHGLPDEKHYTTGHDMALILQQAMQYEEFRKIAGTLTYTIPASDTLTHTIELTNHAKIMHESSEYYYKRVEGAKTGFTQAALNTLVSYAKKDGVELICVILKDYGADNSYKDTKKLYKWAFNKVKQITPLKDFDLESTLKNSGQLDEATYDKVKFLNCQVDQSYSILVKKKFDESAISYQFILDEDKENGRLGRLNIMVGDTMIGSTPVIYDPSTDAAKAYSGGKSIDDNMTAAEVNKKQITPHKVLNYMIRIIIAFVLVFILMQVIRRILAEKKRRQRIQQRNKRRLQSSSSRQPSTKPSSTKTSSSRSSSTAARTSAKGSGSTARTSQGSAGTGTTRRRRSSSNKKDN